MAVAILGLSLLCSVSPALAKQSLIECWIRFHNRIAPIAMHGDQMPARIDADQHVQTGKPVALVPAARALFREYQIKGVLGEGTNAQVLLGVIHPSNPAWKVLGQRGKSSVPVAVKISRNVEYSIESARNEANVYAHLQSHGGSEYLLKTYVPKTGDHIVQEIPRQAMHLDEWLVSRSKNGARFSWEEKQTLWRQLDGILALLKSAGVVHSEIAPKNILVLPNGQLKLIDFGQAVILTSPPAFLNGELRGGHNGFVSKNQRRGRSPKLVDDEESVSKLKELIRTTR